ncbi:MAG: hypothetical protein LBU53_07115 [Zoogloeaceae bacterium]|jgi:hypothetical protein|nr:hypothetical protein [Zoogloeaceae bacterium]
MEKAKGFVSNIRNTVSVSGGGSETETTYISVFQIDSRLIEAKSEEPLMINDGDQVLVVGKTRGGVFNALAYKNISTHVEGNGGWIKKLICSVLCSCLGVTMIVLGFLDSPPFWGPLTISGVIVAAPFINMLFRSISVLRAVKELRQEAL